VGGCTIDGESVRVWREEIVNGEKRAVKIPDETLEEWRIKYGADNWYDWNNQNWGTKWDACDLEFEESPTDEFVTIRFNTAWSFPEPVFDELFEMFPDLTFEGDIEEEGGLFHGYITGCGYELIDGPSPTQQERWESEEEELEIESFNELFNPPVPEKGSSRKIKINKGGVL